MAQTATSNAQEITHLVSAIKILVTAVKFKEWPFNFIHLFRSPEEKHVNPLSNSPKLRNSFFLDAQVLRVTDRLFVEYAWTRDAASPTSLKWSLFSLTAPVKGPFSGGCSGSHLVCVRETAENQETYFLSSGFYRAKYREESLRLSHSRHIIKKPK